MKTKQLSEGWNEKKISEFTKVITGGTPSTMRKEYWERGDIPWLPSGDLKDKPIKSAHIFITKDGLKNSAAQIMPKKSVLIALTGATTGQTALLEIEASANQSVTVILPSKEHIPEFLFYYLRTIRNKILSQTYGGAQPHISQGFVKNLIIQLPPLKVQKAIVSILEKVESLKKKREQANKLADEYLKSVFWGMFLKDRNNFEEVELGDVCEINPKKSEIEKVDRDTNISFVPMEDMGEHNIYFEPKRIKKINEVYSGYTYFKEKDILLAKVTPCFENGKSGIARGLKNNIGFGSSEYHVLRVSKNILPELVYYFISSGSFINSGKTQLTGTGGLRRLPRSYVANFKIPLPPLQLQQKFASIVEQVEKLKEKQKQSKEEINTLFDSLMQKAFRGELVG